MDCIIFVILTDEHVGLNESLATAKYMQAQHKVALLTYDLSHHKGMPLLDEDVVIIKDIIESMNNHYDNIKIYIIADKSQSISVKKHFSNTEYDINAYVMRDVINLSE